MREEQGDRLPLKSHTSAVRWLRHVKADSGSPSNRPRGSPAATPLDDRGSTGGPLSAIVIAVAEWLAGQAHCPLNGANAAYAVAGEVDRPRPKFIAGHEAGMSDKYVLRHPEKVAECCRAIEGHYFG